MGLSVFLGNQLVPTPGDVDRYKHDIVRDFDRRIIYSEAPGTVTFTGGAYRILREAFTADFCASLSIRIYDDCAGQRVLVVSGEVILADVTWNLARCSAETPIQMGSVGARILDNMDLVLTPIADRSKNDQAITPVPSFALTVFDPQNPGTTTTRGTYDWKAAMQHALNFLTDGTVAIDNVWYDALPDDERLSMVHGVYWRTGTQPLDPVSWSLSSLWLEIAKRFNLWMVVRQGATGITGITILSDDDTFAATAGITIEYIDGIKQSIDEDALFGGVKVGEDRERNRVGSAFSALPYYLSLSHTEEDYGVRCLCNRGNILDLSVEWVADHGTLERVMWRDTTVKDADERVCLLQYTDATNTVTANAYASPGVPLYNVAMLNYRVLNRYRSLCDVITPQDPTGAVLAVNNTLLSLDTAYRTGLTVSWQPEGSNIVGSLAFPPLPPSPGSAGIYDTWPIDFPPLGSDPDNAWTLSSRYTASSTGMRTVSWSFRSSVRVDSGASNIDPRRYWRLRVFIRHYTSANVLINTLQAVGGIYASGAFGLYASNAVLFMGSTDYLTITFVPEVVLPDDFQSVTDLTFQLSAATNRWIAITTAELGIASAGPGTRRIALVEFQRHVSTAQWVSMLDDPRVPLSISGAGLGPTTAWISRVSRDILRGTTDLTLIHAL